MQKDGPYVGFQSVDFGVNSEISVGENELHLGECIFRQSYSCLFIYVSHLASGVIVKPKYLKGPTCFKLFPLQRILHAGISFISVIFTGIAMPILMFYHLLPSFLSGGRGPLAALGNLGKATTQLGRAFLNIAAIPYRMFSNVISAVQG